MARIRRIALLGNSVVASSLASMLRERPELDVVQLGATSPELLARLREAHPDAVVLCDQPTPPDLIFSLLGEYPDIPVVSADVDGEKTVVLSSRQASLRTEDDLLEALGQRPPRGCSRPAPQGGRR